MTPSLAQSSINPKSIKWMLKTLGVLVVESKLTPRNGLQPWKGFALPTKNSYKVLKVSKISQNTQANTYDGVSNFSMIVGYRKTNWRNSISRFFLKIFSNLLRADILWLYSWTTACCLSTVKTFLLKSRSY